MSTPTATQNVVLQFIADYHLNEYSDVLGLAITIVGFAFTLWKVSRSRQAAEAAKKAAQETKAELRQIQLAIGLQSVIAELEEIKSLLQSQSWVHLAGRCSRTRQNLIQLRHSSSNLPENTSTAIQSVVANLRTFEEKALAIGRGENVPANIGRMTNTTLDSVDKLSEILSTARNP